MLSFDCKVGFNVAKIAKLLSSRLTNSRILLRENWPSFDFKFGMHVREHIVCLVKKFDQNL